MGVMAMEITKITRVVGVNSLGVLDCGRERNRGFQDRGLRECNINHGLEMRKFRKIIGGMTDNITQRTWRCMLWS